MRELDERIRDHGAVGCLTGAPAPGTPTSRARRAARERVRAAEGVAGPAGAGSSAVARAAHRWAAHGARERALTESVARHPAARSRRATASGVSAAGVSVPGVPVPGVPVPGVPVPGVPVPGVSAPGVPTSGPTAPGPTAHGPTAHGRAARTAAPVGPAVPRGVTGGPNVAVRTPRCTTSAPGSTATLVRPARVAAPSGPRSVAVPAPRTVRPLDRRCLVPARPRPARSRVRGRLERFLTGVAVLLCATTAVVALGLLGDAAAGWNAPAAAVPSVGAVR
ncbi:hypothetical protein Ae717Ps2_3665c [Pseudonocardia sp. Ae717_Ps2]|uniref:hypothetical protein n=1 Tax=Pseudonocardia sp. Ae717_Ps2 TaxID=1885573 RepID=UPI00094B6F78|nr:hypothetical protein [Pseudonocardia sp. Ae717_Ps2]OLM32769.1 hypothetical protein Ae717Ps2_3665c [Pseudonocardia sp. Ae717_Ps2]